MSGCQIYNRRAKEKSEVGREGPRDGGGVLAGEQRVVEKTRLSFISVGRICKINMLISLLKTSKGSSHLLGLIECLFIEVRIKLNEP